MNPEGPVVVKVSVVIDTRITVVGEAEAVTVTVEGIGYGSGPESVIVTNPGPELLLTVPPGNIGAGSGFEGCGWGCRGFTTTPEVEEHDTPDGLAFWIGMSIGVMIKCGDPFISLVS